MQNQWTAGEKRFNSHSREIGAAVRPHLPQPPAATFKRLYRTRARALRHRPLPARMRASDKTLTFNQELTHFYRRGRRAPCSVFGFEKTRRIASLNGTKRSKRRYNAYHS